jgi:hypothetical protein
MTFFRPMKILGTIFKPISVAMKVGAGMATAQTLASKGEVKQGIKDEAEVAKDAGETKGGGDKKKVTSLF